MTSVYPQHSYEPEEGSTQILLVRHGQSAPYDPARPFDLVDGHGDPPLTDLGKYQATLVGERLRSEPISGIYVSSLTRTHQTAEPLAGHLQVTPRQDDDFREVFLGDFEGGRFRKAIADGHPAVEVMRSRQDWGAIPGAESNAQLTQRTVAAATRVAEAHTNELVAVFCHGGVIASLVAYAANANPFFFSGSRHTAVSHLVIGPSGWTVRSFNDGSHMGTLTMDNPLPST